MAGSLPRADVGVFGGSGFYRFLDDVTEVAVETPYGSTSAPVAIGSLGSRTVAFLPRHGAHHEHPPHRVPYRANVWAMHALGVTNVFGPCASGSLQAGIVPGRRPVIFTPSTDTGDLPRLKIRTFTRIESPNASNSWPSKRRRRPRRNTPPPWLPGPTRQRQPPANRPNRPNRNNARGKEEIGNVVSRPAAGYRACPSAP